VVPSNYRRRPGPREACPDLLVTPDAILGDVTLLLNDAPHSFSQTRRFRAIRLDVPAVRLEFRSSCLSSPARPGGLVAGDFTHRDRLNRPDHRQCRSNQLLLAANDGRAAS